MVWWFTGFEPLSTDWGFFFFLEFAYSARVCVGFLRVLGFPPTVQCELGHLATLNGS